MNNDIVNNETDLLCYRLRTERERKRAARDEFDKNLRALNRERQELRIKQRNLGWTELNPPVIRGWNRFFVLREDVARSKYAKFFQGILDKINTVQWCNRKDFKRVRRKDKKRGLVEKGQELKHLQDWEVVKLGFTETELYYFEQRRKYDYVRKTVRTWYVFTEPWRFVPKVEANIITKTRIRDFDIENRYAEIDAYFVCNNLSGRLDKLLGLKDYWRSSEYDKDRIKERRRFRDIPLPKILNAISEEY